MSTITKIPAPEMSLREQAEAKVREEINASNLVKLTNLIRQREQTKKVLAGIDLQIDDLEQQISDGTA